MGRNRCPNGHILTDKQRRFCLEYLQDMDAKKAAIRAGYSERSAKSIGSENLTKPAVRACIDELMAERESELIASADEVLQYFTRTMRGESTAVEVVVEGQGEGKSEARLIEKVPSELERLKAAEQLAKVHGLYRDEKRAQIERERLEMDRERLEMEKRSREQAETHSDSRIIIDGFESGWCD